MVSSLNSMRERQSWKRLLRSTREKLLKLLKRMKEVTSAKKIKRKSKKRSRWLRQVSRILGYTKILPKRGMRGRFFKQGKEVGVLRAVNSLSWINA